MPRYPSLTLVNACSKYLFHEIILKSRGGKNLINNLTFISCCFSGLYFGFTLNNSFEVSLVLSGNQKSK